MSIATNRKANFDYEICEKEEAGIVLEGWEVKSLRKGGAQIQEAYVSFRNGEVYLEGAHIAPLIGSAPLIETNPLRKRKLLLKLDQIEDLAKAVSIKGFTVVPLDFHYSRNLIKCTLGLAKGKKKHDKRDSLKEKDANREISIAVKSERRSK